MFLPLNQNNSNKDDINNNNSCCYSCNIIEKEMIMTTTHNNEDNNTIIVSFPELHNLELYELVEKPKKDNTCKAFVKNKSTFFFNSVINNGDRNKIEEEMLDHIESSNNFENVDVSYFHPKSHSMHAFSHDTDIKFDADDCCCCSQEDVVCNKTTKGSSSLPWGLAKSTLAVVYLLVASLSGSFFFNWPAAQEMFIKAGTYHWLCEAYGEDTSNVVSLNQTYICTKQISAVNELMPAGVASMFVFAFFGGLSLDNLGPKTTALIGLILQTSGWLLLSYCNGQGSPYLLAVILMGLGNDPVQLALVNGANLFPNHRSAALGILMSTRMLGLGIPSTINLLMISTHWELCIFCWIYVSILVLCSCLVLWFFPRHCFPRNCINNTTDAILTGFYGQKVTATESFYLSDKSRQLIPYKSNFAFAGYKSLFRSGSVISLTSTTAESCSFHNCSPAGSGGYRIPDDFRISRAIPKNMTIQPPVSSFDGYHLEENNFNEDQTALYCVEWPTLYLPLFPIAATTILSITFYGISAPKQLGSSIVKFVAAISPLAFIPGVLIGIIADRKGPTSVMILISAFCNLQFALLLLKDWLPFFGYLASIAGCIVMSFFLTQFYCYIFIEHFNSHYFGTLIGTVILFSGLVSLVATPMCDFSSFEGNFQPMNGLCLILNSFNVIFLIILSRENRRISQKSLKATTTTQPKSIKPKKATAME